jgi:hypothetical protein
MFNIKNVEQRINPIPYEYFEYETIINKQNKSRHLISFFNFSVKKRSKIDIKLSTIISKILLTSIKCTKNLAFFLGNCLFFSLNKTRFYMLLKEKDFSDGRVSQKDFLGLLAPIFLEMQVRKINNRESVNSSLFYVSKYFSKVPILHITYKKAYNTFIKKYNIYFNKDEQLLFSPARIFGQISKIVFFSLVPNMRLYNRFFDVSFSMFETAAVIFKVYQALEECKALYKKNPDLSLVNAAFYISNLGLSLFKLYNTINYISYYAPSPQPICRRVDSLSDKLEERLIDNRLKPHCLDHQAQLINPKYKFEIIEEIIIEESMEESEFSNSTKKFKLIKKISPLNFEVSELKKTCRKFATKYHPDKNKSPKAEEISKRILSACKEMKMALIQLHD